MMTTNVELYEALKPTVGAEAARMIAEVVPPTRDLATKADVAETNARIAAFDARMREEFASVRGEMREAFAGVRGEVRERHEQLRVEIHRSHTSTLRWFLGFSVPLWLGTWGTVVAVLLRS